MKPFIVTLSIVAGLLVIGVIVLLVSTGGNLRAAFGMEERTLKSWTASGPVTSLKIRTSDDNVAFRASGDGSFTITCYESAVHAFDITQDGGSLTVSHKHTWLPSINFGKSYTMTVSMPERDLETLDVSVSSGGIAFDMGIRVGSLKAHTSSGSVSLSGFTADTLYAGATSGNVSVSGAKAGTAEAHVTSGNITLSGVTADLLKTSAASGPAKLENCSARSLDAHATSGNIIATGLDAGTAAVSVTSGNVSLELAVADPRLYRLELSSTSGRVAVSGGGYETSSSGSLSLGSGNQLVKAGVTSGNITVRFRDAIGQ